MAPPKVLKAVDLTLRATAGHERPDLEARLQRTRARVLDEHVRVLVVGEFKQGKSSLVNALVNGRICPVNDDIATAVPTAVREAEQPTASLVREREADGAGTFHEERTEIPFDKLGEYVSEAGNPSNRDRLSRVEVGVPRQILKDGLELVDTPGVGGLGSVHGSTTMATMPSADAVLLVSDAAQEYTATELEFLRQARKLCPNVACVVTKIDLYPQWRRMVELDGAHLAAAEIQAEIFPVSSMLRVHALRDDSTDLNTESGFPSLIKYLRQGVVRQADSLSRRAVRQELRNTIEQLAVGLRSELAAQQNPEDIEQRIGELNEAQERSAALKDRAARWQQTLNDGVADLNADIDYDLRDRIRQITHEAEAEIEIGGDPTKMWERFSTWIEQQTSSAVSANFVWASQRAEWLAEQVADHFSEEGTAALPTLRTESTSSALDRVQELAYPKGEKFGLGAKALSGLRGGYMGTLMFGLIGTVAGLALLNPFSAAAGILLGGRQVREEQKRVVNRRKAEAKTAVRRYCEEITFQAGKDSRDMCRRMQRDLRDHFTALAEEMNRSIRDSVQGAENAMKTSKADREHRLRDLKSELQKLGELEKEVRALLSEREAG